MASSGFPGEDSCRGHASVREAWAQRRGHSGACFRCRCEPVHDLVLFRREGRLVRRGTQGAVRGISIHRRHCGKGSAAVGDIRAVHPGDDSPLPGETVSAAILCLGTDQPNAMLPHDRAPRRTEDPQGSPEGDGRWDCPEAAPEGTESRRRCSRLTGMINFCFLVAPAAKGFVAEHTGRDEELVMHFMDILKRGIVA